MCRRKLEKLHFTTYTVCGLIPSFVKHKPSVINLRCTPVSVFGTQLVKSSYISITKAASRGRVTDKKM